MWVFPPSHLFNGFSPFPTCSKALTQSQGVRLVWNGFLSVKQLVCLFGWCISPIVSYRHLAIKEIPAKPCDLNSWWAPRSVLTGHTRLALVNIISSRVKMCSQIWPNMKKKQGCLFQNKAHRALSARCLHGFLPHRKKKKTQLILCAVNSCSDQMKSTLSPFWSQTTSMSSDRSESSFLWQPISHHSGVGLLKVHPTWNRAQEKLADVSNIWRETRHFYWGVSMLNL